MRGGRPVFAISFYIKHLDFRIGLHPAPGFATLSRGTVSRVAYWRRSNVSPLCRAAYSRVQLNQ